MEEHQSSTNWNISKVSSRHLQMQTPMERLRMKICKLKSTDTLCIIINKYILTPLTRKLNISYRIFRSPQHHEDKLQPNKEDAESQSKGIICNIYSNFSMNLLFIILLFGRPVILPH